MPQRDGGRKAIRKRHGRSSANSSSPGKKRLVAFGVLAAAVLLATAYFLRPVFRDTGASSPDVVPVQLSMAGFSPSQIEARLGEPLTLRLVNNDNQFHTDGGGWHQFAIDELGANVEIPPLKTVDFTLTPSKGGGFQFYCDVCCGGKDNPLMLGTLTVKG